MSFCSRSGAAMANAASTALLIGDWDWVDSAGRELDIEVSEANLGSMWGAVQLIMLSIFRGDFDGALTEIERLRLAVGGRPDPQTQSQLIDLEFELALLSGDIAGAIAAAERGIAMGIPGQASQSAVVGGRAGIWARDVVVVRRMLDVARAESLGRLDAARADALEAAAAALEGDHPAALDGFGRAVATMREVGAAFDVALTQLDRLIVMPDGPGSAEAATEARAILERLGARPFLERLEQAVATAVDEPTEAEVVLG